MPQVPVPMAGTHSTTAISDSIVVSVASITGMQNYKFLLTSVQDLAEKCYKKLQTGNFSVILISIPI